MNEYIAKSIFRNVIKDPLNKICTLNRVKELTVIDFVPGENVESEVQCSFSSLVWNCHVSLFNFRITFSFSTR